MPRALSGSSSQLNTGRKCVCVGGVGTSLGNIRATNCKRGQKLGNILNYKKAVAQVEDWRIVTERDGGGGKYVDVMIRSIL